MRKLKKREVVLSLILLLLIIVFLIISLIYNEQRKVYRSRAAYYCATPPYTSVCCGCGLKINPCNGSCNVSTTGCTGATWCGNPSPSPTPYVRVVVKNKQGTNVQMQRICLATCTSTLNSCSQPNCAQDDAAKNFPKAAGVAKQGGKTSLQTSTGSRTVALGATPSQVGGQFFAKDCPVVGGACYVWNSSSWTTGERKVTFIVATPTTGVGATNTPTPVPTSGPTNTPVPTVTTAPNAARLKFIVKLPDISSNVTPIDSSYVKVEVYDGSTFVTYANAQLTKQGDYYVTSQEVSLNISAVAAKAYKIAIKQAVTLRRIFANVTLTPSASLDCTATNSSCGELNSQTDTKTLLSGDSDGFNTSSGSYNKIDSADLQALASQYNSGSGGTADFNFDGQVNISDLDILGRNYGLQGD